MIHQNNQSINNYKLNQLSKGVQDLLVYYYFHGKMYYYVV